MFVSRRTNLHHLMRNAMRYLLPLYIVFYTIVSARGELEPAGVVKEIRSGLDRLEALESTTKTYNVREFTSKNREKTRVGEFSVVKSGDDILLRSKRIVLCLRNGQMFGVEKTKQSENWVVRLHERQTPAEAFRKSSSQRNAAVYPLTSIDLTNTVRKVIDGATFKATSAKTRPDGNIDLSYEIDMQQGRYPYIETGTLTVNPNFHYVVVSKVCRSHGPKVPSPLRTVFTRVVEAVGGEPRCKSVKVVGSEESTGLEGANDTYEFFDYDNAPVDPAIFTLDYYKLTATEAAPEDYVPPQWPKWAAGGVICVALSLAFGWFARRRANKQS